MGITLSSQRGAEEPCLLFEDCGVLSADPTRGLSCLDYASPSCATGGVAVLKAKLAVRKAMLRVHERLRDAAIERDGSNRD